MLAAFATRERSAEAVERICAGSWPAAGCAWAAATWHSPKSTNAPPLTCRRAETFAFPILLLLSFWVFRGLIAAALPLLVGGFAIVVTFLLLRLIDQFAGLSIFAVNLVTGMGLGLGIDYSLFVLSRYREELAGGFDTPRGDRAHAADGRADRALQLADGRRRARLHARVSAALPLLDGDRRGARDAVRGGRLADRAAGRAGGAGPADQRAGARAPAAQRRRRPATRRANGACGFVSRARSCAAPAWSRWALRSCCSCSHCPALRLELTPADAHVLPASSQARLLAETITHDFAVDGSQTITIVVRAPAGAARAVAELARRAQLTAGAQASLGLPRYLGRGVWEIELLPHGVEGAPANEQLVRRLRALAPPSTAPAGAPGAGAAVPSCSWAARAAWFVDQKAAIAAHTPLALAILALVTGGFLFLMTGSLVLPLVALADEPAHGRRRRGPARADLPGRAPLRTVRLQPDRGPGGVEPRAAVRRRVRPLHRLRRVPVRAHQGGA